MPAFAKAVYALLGVLALADGAVVLVWPSALVRASDPPVVTHLLQEQAAAFVFIGLLCLWCRTHFAQRRSVHAALVVFAGLYAAVHWWGVLRGDTPSAGSYATLALVILLAAMWPRSNET
jgi:hypothetical protein